MACVEKTEGQLLATGIAKYLADFGETVLHYDLVMQQHLLESEISPVMVIQD